MDFVAFVPKSLTEWKGKKATVVYCPNCNFKCPYCYNYQLVLFPNKIPRMDEERFFEELQQNAWDLDAVVITGGEPTLQGLKLFDFCDAVKEFGLSIKVDSNGSNPEVIRELLEEELVDFISMDVKTSLNSQKYFEATGKRVVVRNILDSIELLKHSKIDYEFKTTVVPGLIQEEDVIDLSKHLLNAKKFVLQQFKSLSGTLDKKFSSVPNTPRESLLSIAQKISGIGEVCIRTEKGEEIVSTSKNLELVK